jgi:hypothetical protein
MSLITLKPSATVKLDSSSNIDYTYPALRGVKMVNGKYSYQLNQSLSPNFIYNSTNIFISGRAKNYYIVEPSHQFGTEKTHEYELVIEHYTESGTKFFVVLPLKTGGTSTLNNVIKSTNTVGETLDLNKDMKNPSNIYRYFGGSTTVFVFQSYINVYAISDDKLSKYPFTPPDKPNLFYMTGNRKFSDELVCGEEDIVKPQKEPDTTYIFIMVLIGFVLLTASIIGFSWFANTESIAKRMKIMSLVISIIVILTAMGVSIGLYLKYDKKRNAMYKTIFGSLSVIFTFIAVAAIFSLRGIYAPVVSEKPTEVVGSLGSRIMNSWNV